MGVGYVILPIVILLFYILPVALYFVKKINKKTRKVIISIPLFLTIILATFIFIDNYKQEELYKKFPEINKITFKNSTEELKDSIFQLEKLMLKLPKRTDYNSINYSLDKFKGRHNLLRFNWFKIGTLNDLKEKNNLINYKINISEQADWREWVNNDIKPFNSLSPAESKRFIKLIEFLDQNSLSAMKIEDNMTTFSYNDSLRISDGLGFRTITMDTTDYYGPPFFKIIDRKDGFYLLVKM
ncbi:MAG: hypothetical protein ACJARP_002335 [Vicingaceae bacterium]|jgi:hypothetical protein